MPGGAMTPLKIDGERVLRLRDAGRTTEEIAAFFGVTVRQLTDWVAYHLQIPRSVVRGRGIPPEGDPPSATTAPAIIADLKIESRPTEPQVTASPVFAPDAPSPFRKRSREGGIAIAIVIEGARVIVPPFEIEGEIIDVEVAIAAAEIRRRLDGLLGEGGAA